MMHRSSGLAAWQLVKRFRQPGTGAQNWEAGGA